MQVLLLWDFDILKCLSDRLRPECVSNFPFIHLFMVIFYGSIFNCYLSHFQLYDNVMLMSVKYEACF